MPAAHVLQELAPAEDHFPAPQLAQVDDAVAPDAPEAVPAVQAVQDVALPPDQNPGPHCTGFEETEGHSDPAGHAAQLDAAAAVE